MKTFEVEMQRISYVTLTVEADNVDEAEALAYKRMADDYYKEDGNWTTESIEELA